jgi:hypothetical protein
MSWLLLAAATHSTPLEKLQKIPTRFWIYVGIAIAVIIAAIIVLRKLAHVNKIVLAVIVLIAGSTIGFNWIYDRNEPKWATPAVEWLAQFFPSKGSYTATQSKP